MQLNLGFRSGRSSSFHALFVAALSLLCLSSCGAITAARGSALPVGSIVDDSAAIRDGGGAADGAVILPTIAPGINAAMIATPPPPSFSAGAAGAAAPPQLAPVFQLSRPEMVIRPPGSEPFPAALAGSEQDVRRYIVQIAAPTTQLNAATGGGSSAPPPASPPSMASMSDAQRFLGSTLPAFDSSRLTHVFPAPPSTISSSSGLGGPSGFHGFSAFLRPSEVDALRNVSVVRSLEEDSRVKLDLRPGSMPQRASATASSSSSGNGGSIGLGVQPSNTASQGTAGRTTSVDAANLQYVSVGLRDAQGYSTSQLHAAALNPISQLISLWLVAFALLFWCLQHPFLGPRSNRPAQFALRWSVSSFLRFHFLLHAWRRGGQRRRARRYVRRRCHHLPARHRLQNNPP